MDRKATQEPRPRRLLLIRTFKHLAGGGPIPPLGLLYVAAAVRRAPGLSYEVRVEDMGPGHLLPDDLRDPIERFGPDVVGLSSLTCEADVLHEVARVAKTARPEAPVLVGGPHASAVGARLLSDRNIDVVVLGEGEDATVEVLSAVEEGRSLAGVQGIAFREGEETRTTAPRDPVGDLDGLAYPAWDLIDLDVYSRIPNWNGVLKERRYAPILTSRGCPYRCIYCHNLFGRAVRTRSLENVLDEMAMLERLFGVREFHVVDDAFNVDPERVSRLCAHLAASGRKYALAFPNGLRPDRMTPQLVEALLRAGTYKVNFGFETVEPRLQELLRKNLDLPRAQEMIRICAATRIITGAYFMLGLPTETRQEMERTVEFAVRSDLDVAYFFKATSYPGTDLDALAHPESEDRSSADFSDHHFYSVARSHAAAPAETVNDLILVAQRRFFLRGRRLWRAFLKWPSKRAFLRSLLGILGALVASYLLRRLRPVRRADEPGGHRP